MDYMQLPRLAADLAKLNAEELDAYLSELQTSDPAEFALAQSILLKRDITQSFMQTQDPSSSTIERPETANAPGDKIGPWKLLDLIAFGGMGAVWRAERADGNYTQKAALKLLYSKDEKLQARFELERQRLAKLEHPGISRLIDGGTSKSGQAYMAMELVEGVPIDQVLGAETPSVTVAVKLVLQLCSALTHAHGQLVLHRDIKPANVLVDRDQRVRLVDFGIAALVETEGAGGGALTPATAAPEQLAGSSQGVGVDVFGVGLLLSTLLQGHVPVRQSDGGVILKLPAKINRDLAEILAVATATDPEGRYSSISAFSADLENCLNNAPVAVRRGGPAYRFGKFIQRNRAATALGAIALVSLTAGLGVSLWQADRARAAAATAEYELEKSQFFLERSNAYFSAQEIYGDVLQRLYGRIDGDEIDQTLMDLWKRAYEGRTNSEEDARRAGAVSYAVGVHFRNRNDYKRAREVMEPWLDEEFGAERMIEAGRQVYTTVLQRLGENEAAIPFLRQTVADFEQGFERHFPDHAALASHLARLTGDEGDARYALETLEQAAKEDVGPYISMYFAAQASQLREQLGEYDEALADARAALDILEAQETPIIYGAAAVRLRLARLLAYHERDFTAAEVQIDEILGPLRDEAGVMTDTLDAMSLLAEIETARDGPQAGLATLERLPSLMDEFSNDTVWNGQSGIELNRAIWAYITGDRETARDSLARAESILEDKPSKHLDLARAVLGEDAVELARLKAEADESLPLSFRLSFVN